MAEAFSMNRPVPIDGSYDVVVAGGGVAGVGAAVAAARSGRSVLLIEKTVAAGGLATIGFIDYYEPLCDGLGVKIIGGIAEELLHESIKYGFNNLPSPWKPGSEDEDRKGTRYHTRFSPSAFILALDELLENEGVDVLFDTLICDMVMEGPVCRGVIAANKSGLIGFRTSILIDATGDAEFMARAGVPCVEGSNWLTYCGYMVSLSDFARAIASGDVRDALRLKTWGATRLGVRVPEGSGKYVGVDGREITKFIMDGRRLVREDVAKMDLREKSLTALPSMAQLRTIRRIEGMFLLEDKHVSTHFEDSVGSICDFSTPGPVYEIPYRTLIASGFPNLITAGRSISSTGTAWEMTRVIPPAVLTGQAAGTAAALALERGCTLQDVPVKELQDRLASAGVLIHNPQGAKLRA